MKTSYPNKVFQFDDVDDSFDSFCSMIIVSLHYPKVNFNEVSIL